MEEEKTITHEPVSTKDVSQVPGYGMRMTGIITFILSMLILIIVGTSDKRGEYTIAVYLGPIVLAAIFGAIMFVGGELKRTLYDLLSPPNEEEEKP